MRGPDRVGRRRRRRERENTWAKRALRREDARCVRGARSRRAASIPRARRPVRSGVGSVRHAAKATIDNHYPETVGTVARSVTALEPPAPALHADVSGPQTFIAYRLSS